MNAITISNDLERAGLEKKAADAIASKIVDFKDESSATKADLIEVKAELKNDITRVETKLNIGLGLIVGIFIAILAIFIKGS